MGLIYFFLTVLDEDFESHTVKIIFIFTYPTLKVPTSVSNATIYVLPYNGRQSFGLMSHRMQKKTDEL